jgi:mono/diheme cytochrome c family protein
MRTRGQRSRGACLALLAALAVACTPAATPSPTPAPPTPADPTLSLGAAVYARECASCHGARGEGEPEWQVTRPDGSLPAPPHDASGHTWHHPDGELRRIIELGGTVYMPESNMPAFGETLTGEEIDAVLAFIKTLWGPRERSHQAEQTMLWERMRTGAATPGG